GATVSMVNARAAVPVLPAASVAATTTVWLPSASDAVVNGEVHATAAPPSTAHVVVPSLTVKPKLGVLLFVGVGPTGPLVMVTTGFVVSTVITEDAVPVLPALSVAATVSV